MKKPAAAGRGRTAKHTAAGKHTHGRNKHHPAHTKSQHHQHTQAKVHTVGKPPAKKRQLSLGNVACCSAEALAASARLAGHQVSADDVLALYWRTARDPDAGASILATLEAGREFGLGGRLRPRWFKPLDLAAEIAEHGPEFFLGLEPSHALILGLELPGPHAVTVAPDGSWLSWGGHTGPDEWPAAVVEEAWEVAWLPC